MAQTRNKSMSRRRRLLKSFAFSWTARLVVRSAGPAATSAIEGLPGDQEQHECQTVPLQGHMRNSKCDRPSHLCRKCSQYPAATKTEQAIHASRSRRCGAWSLDEFNDVPVRVGDIAAGDPVPGTTRIMQDHGVARYLTRLRALDTFQRGVKVIHAQRDVRAAGVAAPGPDRSSRWADVPDQLYDPPVASVQVSDLYLDRVFADKQGTFRASFGHPADQPQTQPATPELHGTIQIGHGQADVVDGTHHAAPQVPNAARSRSGTLSRPRTSSMVSLRLTTSADVPQTSTVAGRGRPLKFPADASW